MGDRDADFEREVFAEQVRSLYAKGPVALIANVANASILVAVLWGVLDHRAALSWWAIMAITVGLRFAMVRQYRRAAIAPAEACRWERRWTISTAIAGAIWGGGAALLYPAHSTLGQYLIMFVVGGMVAGASTSMSSFVPAFVAFTVPALIPPIVRLVGEGDFAHRGMALFMAIFAAGMTAVARQGGRALVESIRLRIHNAKLADDLAETHRQVVIFNRELEQRVKARTEELEQTIAARDNLVSIVSHELRSPLSSLVLNHRTLGKLLADTALDREPLRRSIDILARQLNRLRHIVDDLFDVRRLSTDQMTYSMESMDLRSIVDETMEEMAPQLEMQHAEFQVELEGVLRGRSDRFRLQQVLVNLLSNALKYGAGPRSLSAHRVGSHAEIVVHDSGPGISPELLPHLFDPFRRGASRGTAGLGLGLYIAERIVSAHHGTIRVDNGHGANFIIDLPLDPGLGSAH